MRPLLIRLAPTAFVVALTAYCCGLTTVNPPTGGKGGRKGAALDPALLEPGGTADPGRDPFGLHDASSLIGKQKSVPPPVKAVRAAPPDLAGLVRGLSLKATCVREDGGVAVINGQFYNQGQTVKMSGAGAFALVVAQVCEDRVVLRLEDQTVELKFSDQATKSTRPRTGATRQKTRSVSSRAKPGVSK